MKHIKTYESFLNESREERTMMIPAGTELETVDILKKAGITVTLSQPPEYGGDFEIEFRTPQHAEKGEKILADHFGTNESKTNESHVSSTAEWDPTTKVIKITGGIADPAGIRCNNGKIETFYDGMRGSYTYALGISCPERKWEEAAPDMIDDLNTNISWLGGLVSKPIDAEAKKLAIEIIKSNL